MNSIREGAMHSNKSFCSFLILINFHFSITLAVRAQPLSKLSLNDFSSSHEKDTECVFGFSLAQNAQIISRLEPITHMFAFLNPGCNSSCSALGCNTAQTSSPLWIYSRWKQISWLKWTVFSLLWLWEAVLFFNKLQNQVNPWGCSA